MKGDLTDTKKIFQNLEGKAGGIKEVGKLQNEAMTVEKQKAMRKNGTAIPSTGRK